LKASDVGSLMCTCSSMRSLADDDEEFAHLLLTKHLGPVKPLLRRILNEEEHEIAPNTYSYDARLIWATAYAKRNDELIHGEEKQRNESIDECAVHPRNHPVISKSGGLCMFSEGPRGGLQEEEADPEGWKKKEEKWDAEEAEQIQGYVAKGAEWCLAEARRLGFDDDDLPDVADVTNDEDFLEELRECKDREDRKATPPEKERKQARELLTDVVERWSSGKLLRTIGRYMNLCLSVHNPCCHMDEKKSAEVLGYKSQEMLRTAMVLGWDGLLERALELGASVASKSKEEEPMGPAERARELAQIRAERGAEREERQEREEMRRRRKPARIDMRLELEQGRKHSFIRMEIVLTALETGVMYDYPHMIEKAIELGADLQTQAWNALEIAVDMNRLIMVEFLLSPRVFGDWLASARSDDAAVVEYDFGKESDDPYAKMSPTRLGELFKMCCACGHYALPSLWVTEYDSESWFYENSRERRRKRTKKMFLEGMKMLRVLAPHISFRRLVLACPESLYEACSTYNGIQRRERDCLTIPDFCLMLLKSSWRVPDAELPTSAEVEAMLPPKGQWPVDIVRRREREERRAVMQARRAAPDFDPLEEEDYYSTPSGSEMDSDIEEMPGAVSMFHHDDSDDDDDDGSGDDSEPNEEDGEAAA